MILPRTAAETGGICMACKQGIRASMEASREHYRKLKQYDPQRELWKWLVGKAQADPGLGSLSTAHRHYFAVGMLEGEVYNGGFDQFFSNSSGAYYALAAEGLEKLKAEASQSLLQDAARLVFGAATPPLDRQKRRDAVKRYAETRSSEDPVAAELDALDRRFWADPDNLGEKLAAFAQQSGILEPFEKEP